MRTLIPLVIAFVPTLSAPAHAVQAQLETGGEKRARPLPEMQDVKTPAPVGAEAGSSSPQMPSEEPAVSHAARTRTPAAGAPRKSGSHIRRVHVDALAEEGALWARGRTYKARFGSDGVTYVPFFGSEAPTNHPTRFTLRAARVGDQSIAFDAAAVPVPGSDSVRYERGGLSERWDLRLEQVEQRFELDVLPTGGDLVLEIALDSTLAAAESDGGITFTNELGRVEYSAAVAIDADGRRFAMHTGLVDGSIELRLASTALASARLPLVIDPIVATYAVTQTLNSDYTPDVAYEAGSDTYAVVFEEIFSAADHDVWAEIRDGQGTSVTFAPIDTTTAYWATPRVASSALGQNFLCVAAVGLPSGALRTIQGRMLTPTGSTSVSIMVAGLDAYDKFAPDVGGDPGSIAPTFYCVVWQRAYSSSDHDVHGRLVASDGGLYPTTIFIDNSSATLDSRIAISKSTGHPPHSSQKWTVVWQRWYAPGAHYQIFGAQLHWDGVITHPTYPIADWSIPVRNPRVSSLLDDPTGAQRQYMVVYESQNVFTNDWDVSGVVFIGPTALNGTNIPGQEPGSNVRPQALPCVDTDGRHFAVAYQELFDAQSNDWDIIVADLLFSAGYAFACEFQYPTGTAFPEQYPSIVANYSGNGAQLRYMLAWEKDDYQAGNKQAWIALYDGCPSGLATPFCLGDGSSPTACPCGNTGTSGSGCENSASTGGGYMTWSGQNEVGSDTFVIEAHGLPPGAACLYFQGSLMPGGIYGAPFGDGIMCISTQFVRLAVKFNPTGSSQYPDVGDTPLSIAGSVPAGGKYLFYQVWYRDSAPFCATATYNLASGIEVVWAPY